MTVVVTGATGQLGRLIVESLISRGVAPGEIVATGRQIAKIDDLADRGVKVVRIDYLDEESLATAFAGADTLMLVSASEPGSRLAQHSAAIEAAQQAGITRIVYTSAPHADTSALLLAPEHKGTEEVIRSSGLAFTILRNGWYTENYGQALEQARDTGEIVASVGDGRVASASRIDFADAAAAVIVGDGHENATYELTGDVAWTFSDLADAAAEVLGQPVVYRPVSAEEHTAILTAAGLPAGTATFVVGLDGNIRDGLLSETPGELARLIGRPTTPLADGLRAALAA
ncbi:SDR family oxidoreductase [Glaciibacter superstes]|uniref:SDR family oxidoreductase n=1 Tax=Glaciibacter superstes TaxID=501023 RepID=UPI0003B4A34E|nr:SDR family oxidoreductase [Glaciibacter superstes]